MAQGTLEDRSDGAGRSDGVQLRVVAVLRPCPRIETIWFVCIPELRLENSDGATVIMGDVSITIRIISGYSESVLAFREIGGGCPRFGQESRLPFVSSKWSVR
jgi:hypothetical protein